MNSGETSALNLSEPLATKRTWYVWASAFVAALIATMGGAFIRANRLPQNPASAEGLAFLLIVALLPAALAAAVGLVLNQKWGKSLLLVTALLLSGVFAIATLYLIWLTVADLSGGAGLALLGGLLGMVLTLVPTLCAWLSYTVVRRQNDRLALVAMPIALLLMTVLVLLSLR